GIYARAMDLDLNDPKVTDAVRANLAYDLIARDVDEDGTHFTQTVNKFQYHGFFMRDTSFIAHTYDLLNLQDVAGQTVDHYLIRDASGTVTGLRHDSPDDWGQSLWAIGAHFRATGDLAFAREVHPAIPGHLDDFVTAIKSDPLGLWPVAGPYDNELVNGHYTSHNLWALLGLKEAENLCRAVGDKANADRAHRYYVDFRKTFVNRLAQITAKDDGYIPPGLDDPLAGHDWENASGGVYPFGVFPPFHPWVTATVNMEREYKYREGIMTWGPNAWKGKVAAETGQDYDPLFLHDYDTFQVTETLLARDEQQKVIEDLYSTLVHTSSTHAGFETSIRPWSNRDPDGNFPPHGWFAARYNELVHNMLVREFDGAVHLCSALSPQWIAPGKTMTVERAATNSGVFSFTIHSTATGAVIDIDPKWKKPLPMILHFPWFVHVTSARAGNESFSTGKGEIELKPTVRQVVLKWRWTSHPDLSYARAVRIWLRKAYEPKPGEDMDHLFPTPTRPGLAEPETQFADRYELRLTSRSGEGIVHYTLDGSTPTRRSPVFGKPVTITKPCTVKAIEIWADGRTSDVMIAKLTKAVYVPAVKPAETPDPGGLAYQYYEADIKAMPDFASLTATRSGVAPRGDLDDIQHRAEIFAVQESGYVKAPTDGIYTFWTGSDDGSKLWIDGGLVVDNDGPHAYQEIQGEIALKAGLHTIRVAYWDSGGANYLRLFWKQPGSKKEHFSPDALLH
ncbi:MAG TPA: PA14 domain-containing protein, partial [Fimbriimonadaceae bacterium]|nr:PA14 domain-containing protein [Fimbriimonadaceae bacterium]